MPGRIMRNGRVVEVDESLPLEQEHWELILSWPWYPSCKDQLNAIQARGNIATPARTLKLEQDVIHAINNTLKKRGLMFHLASISESRRGGFMDRKFRLSHLKEPTGSV